MLQSVGSQILRHNMATEQQKHNTKERLRVRGAGALLGRCDSAESYTDLSSFLYLQRNTLARVLFFLLGSF